jgi:glycosyltransferase involved in cell wall biosynthesis
MANQTRQLAELLSGVGAEVQIVQTNAPYRPAFVSRIPIVRAGVRLLPYLFRLWRAAGRCDLFHVMANSGWSWYLFAAPAVRIASMRGVPVVVNYRGGEAATFLARAHRSVCRTMARAEVVTVPSGFLQEIFARYGVRSKIVPNVVDLGRFHPPAANRVRGAHLVVTRNLEPIYDNATAIRVLAIVRKRLPHARLTIAGTGPELQTLRMLAGELGVGDAVDLPGRLDREAVASLYRQADVALNPSTVDNTPNSLLEALASGVPVVSTDVGGVRHIVQDGTTALLVPARDPEAMAGAVLRLLEDPGMANHLAAAGLDAVREYSWPRVLPTLIGAYSKASGRD